jgi:6-phosphogluconate dehydrogenase (decarboxylating)
MQLGMIGLGRMGANILGHVSGLVSEGATRASAMEEFLQKLTKPRAAWVILPASMATIEEAVPFDVLSSSRYTRYRSRQEHTLAEKMLSGMRNKFGGHVKRVSVG